MGEQVHVGEPAAVLYECARTCPQQMNVPPGPGFGWSIQLAWTPRFPGPRTLFLQLSSFVLTPMSRMLTCWQICVTSARCQGRLSPTHLAEVADICQQVNIRLIGVNLRAINSNELSCRGEVIKARTKRDGPAEFRPRRHVWVAHVRTGTLTLNSGGFASMNLLVHWYVSMEDVGSGAVVEGPAGH